MEQLNKVKVAAVLKTWQTLKSGEYPVVVRVYYNGKIKYYGTGLSCTPGKWDKEQGCYKRNKDGNTALTNELQKVQRVVDYIIVNRGGFTFDRFQKMFVKKVQSKPFMKFWEEHLDKLRKEKRSGTADSYEDALRKFRAYRNNKDILINEIDKSVFNGFSSYMKQSGQSVNGVGIYMRSMSAVYGAAIDEGILSPADDTRAGLKIKKESTVKRALSKENMMKFVNADINVGRAHESRNMFVFSYFCQGINFKDLCDLTWSNNIVDDRIVFRRNKTGRLFSVRINDHLREILDECWDIKDKSPLGYIFPVYVDPNNHVSEDQKKKRRNSRARTLNKDLRELAIELGVVELTEEEHTMFRNYRYAPKMKAGEYPELKVPSKLKHFNYYTARHTYATVLKRSGVKTSLISEGLGHSSEHITQVYLDAFDNDELDRAQDALA